MWLHDNYSCKHFTFDLEHSTMVCHFQSVLTDAPKTITSPYKNLYASQLDNLHLVKKVTITIMFSVSQKNLIKCLQGIKTCRFKMHWCMRFHLKDGCLQDIYDLECMQSLYTIDEALFIRLLRDVCVLNRYWASDRNTFTLALRQSILIGEPWNMISSEKKINELNNGSCSLPLHSLLYIDHSP